MTKKRQKCETFSRSMGYIRPVDNFNIGKRAEFEERKTFKENIIFAQLRKLFKKQESKMPCGKKKGGKKQPQGTFLVPDLFII